MHNNDDGQIVVKSDGTRFVVLAVYCAFVLANQFQYVGNAYIIDELSVFLDTSNTAINMLTVLYAAVYVVFAIPACDVFSRAGLTATLRIGMTLNCAGAVIKFVAVLWLPQYAFFVFGQILAAFAQVLCLAAPPLLAATWYPVKERSLATAIGTLFGFIGLALGFSVAPALVSHEHDGQAQFNILYGSQAVWTLLNLIACIIFVPREPEHPPSTTSPLYLKHARERGLQNSGESPARTEDYAADTLNAPLSQPIMNQGTGTTSSIIPLLWSLRHNRGLCVIVFASGLGAGSLTAVSAVLSQVLQPYDVSSTQSGDITLSGILCGCAACVVCGPLLDKFRRYKKPLVVLYTALAGALILTSLSMATIPVSGGVFVPLSYASIILIVVLLLPTLPISLELAVELTFPIDETVSSTACFWWNAFCAAVGTAGATVLVGDEASKADGVIIISCVAAMMLLCALLVGLLVQENLKRLRCENGATSSTTVAD